jgi:hypothetical protein
MSQVFRGYVSEWEVARETGGLMTGQGDLTVKVGSQINRNLTLKYGQRVPGLGRPITPSLTSSPFERDVEAEYRLNRFFYVTSQLTQRRTLTGGVSSVTTTPEFNVSLKARWEY